MAYNLADDESKLNDLLVLTEAKHKGQQIVKYAFYRTCKMFCLSKEYYIVPFECNRSLFGFLWTYFIATSFRFY